MRTLSHELGEIFVPGPRDSLRKLVALANSADAEYWSADTEATGLNQYASDFRVRLVQFGTRHEAWVLDPRYHMDMIERLLYTVPAYWHNWVYDAIAAEVDLGLDFDRIADMVRGDIDIMGRLVDPRPVQKGGTGHKLEQLMHHYMHTASKKEARSALWEAYGRRAKVKIEDIFREIPIDNEEYLRYAGQDIFGTSGVAYVLRELVDADPKKARFERIELPLSRQLSLPQRIGMPFDHDWADKYEPEYDEALELAEKKLATTWDITQTATYVHTSDKNIKAKFTELGHKWTKTTVKGAISMDKDVLREMTQARNKQVAALARDVISARQSKHYGDYLRGMRAEVGFDGKIHPKIRPMGAATARMSVTSPPAQQFPRDDPRIRGALLADPGEVILSADYAQIEFRVGAAVSRDPVMMSRIITGEDLHAVTATALFGPDFTKPQRQVSKPVGFGRLYLGGAPGIYTQMLAGDSTDALPTLSQVKVAIKAFDGDYRVYHRWAVNLKDYVERAGGHLTTATGRPLIVAPFYAAPNYYIQSTARDILAASIKEIHRRGLGDRIRLLVHDEVVASVRPEEAQEVGRELQDAMEIVFKDVPIAVEWEVKEERWRK